MYILISNALEAIKFLEHDGFLWKSHSDLIELTHGKFFRHLFYKSDF